MDSLTRKIVEMEKLLRECYITARPTKTKNLSNVLPTYSALKKLKKATTDILNLWEFYKSWRVGQRLEREWKKMPKSTIKPRKPDYNMEEDLTLDDRPRGHI